MALTKQTVVDQITIDRIGNTSIRLALNIIDDDGTELISSYHRALYPPGTDITAAMADLSTAVQANNGAAPIDQTGVQTVTAVTATIWTPTLVAAYQGKLKV